MLPFNLGKLYFHNFDQSIPLVKHRTEHDAVWNKRSYHAHLSANKNFLLVNVYGPIDVHGNIFWDMKIISEDKLGWFRMYEDNIGYIHEFKEEDITNGTGTNVQEQDQGSS